ncbi:nucleotidyltransferase [Tenacibaculum maritimum]|nr:nucleotidyltransferase [Tenacibaculum maritimum]MDB0600057.1 nucleotidyltransferase [Tenacibaculum maritimum]MDB0601060.1 nucleotidyltransferase [Tenacibaculum maritimum]MDB0601410.1 nucleotidyltransferase [Tenacibaculum maritimum]MDB0612141.1 nucleotidyltransferase [Tenacibaculum maritimum]
MARSIEQIQGVILKEITNSEKLNALDVLTDNEKASLSNLTSASKVSVWRLFVFIVSVSFWTLEKLFDILKKEVEYLLYLLKPHKPSWYRNKILAFQFGHTLGEQDYYNNDGLTALEIQTAKVVKYAAVVEINSKLFIKVAGEALGKRIKLPLPQETALIQYIKLIRDAGVKIELVNRDADLLKLEIDAYYNPLELDANGARLDGTDNEPLQNGLRGYLREFEFNGELVLTKLTDQLQKVKGIEMPVVQKAFYKFGNQLEWTKINEVYQSDAGHMKINNEDLIINWIARDVPL